MRICPFTSVCSELEALKNWECWSVTGATPGARFSRLWKLRFELTSGTFASTFRSIFWAVEALSVCRVAADAVTSTVSVTLPGCSFTSTRVLVSTNSVISLRDSFLNPVASTPTEYTPGGRLGTIQFPLSFVCAV